MTRKKIDLLYAAVVFYAIAPVLSALVCAGIASLTGCQVDDHEAHPCQMAGLNIGGLLFQMGAFAWYMIFTLPTGSVVLVILTLFLTARKIIKTIAKKP